MLDPLTSHRVRGNTKAKKKGSTAAGGISLSLGGDRRGNSELNMASGLMVKGKKRAWSQCLTVAITPAFSFLTPIC